MAYKIFNRFDSGISPFSKSPTQTGANFTKNLDIYSDAYSLSLNPGLAKVSGSTVTDLVKWAVEGIPWDTNRYFLGDAGKVYKETSGGAWSNIFSIATGLTDEGRNYVTPGGQGLAVYNDGLFYSTDRSIGRWGKLSLTPANIVDYFESLDLDFDQYQALSGQTYTLAVTIVESSTTKFSFTPTIDPISSISINVDTKGTGNWTLTLHDVDNHVLASKTITNANVANGSTNTFLFSSPVRITIGNTYHVHVTSTVADGKVVTGTASDLSTAAYNTFWCLIPDSNYHPFINATNGTEGTLLFGNGPFIGEYAANAGAINPCKIVLEPSFSVRSFFKENEFVVAECWKGTAIDGSDEGRLYYWDSISAYYNYSKPITGGLPNASVNFKNRIFSVLGSNAGMSLGTEPFLFIQKAPKLARGKNIEVLPGAIDVWQNRVQMGIGANTDDATGIVQGVYEYGSGSDKDASEALNLGYTISTGDTQGTTMKIGCVKAFGKDLYVSWKNQAGTGYGVDKASKTGNPATTGTWESGIIDEIKSGTPAPQKSKRALRLAVVYDTLPTGCTVTPKYKIDRGSWVSTGFVGGIATTKKAWIDINQDYHEIEVGFDLVATTNYPTITGVMLEYDPKLAEKIDS